MMPAPRPAYFRREKRPITKDAIFCYVYGVLHDPIYREKYALDLTQPDVADTAVGHGDLDEVSGKVFFGIDDVDVGTGVEDLDQAKAEHAKWGKVMSTVPKI